MSTVSDAIPAADAAAADVGNPRRGLDSDADVRMRGRADTRARGAAVVSRGKARVAVPPVWRDLRGAWPWRATPPSLVEVWAGRVPSADRVPDGSPPLRTGWAVWNHAVAVPVTAVLYVVAWVLQHPARAALAALVAGPVALMWIKF